ncbi:MAG: hypothetical protein IRY99_01005 [Isosphaeraceae bacterium]|nr:hypothetical protein [Isosphaeraceae bacterium]
MNLTPGQRFVTGERMVYEVVGPAWETPRHSFHRARKVLWNYRFDTRSLVEADADEWLDVLIREPRGPALPGALAFERERVFSLSGASWFPEPIDTLDSPGLLILADPHAQRLSEVAGEALASPSRVVAFAGELLQLLETLHQAGLVAQGLDPEDVLIDGEGRWFYLGTDRIALASGPESYRDDLTAWAGLIGGYLSDSANSDEVARLREQVRRCLDPDPSRRPIAVAEWWASPIGAPPHSKLGLQRALGALGRVLGLRGDKP